MNKFRRVIRDAESRNKLVRSETHQTAIDFERLVSLVFGLPGLPDELRPLLKTTDPRETPDDQPMDPTGKQTASAGARPPPAPSTGLGPATTASERALASVITKTQPSTEPMPKPDAAANHPVSAVSAEGRRIFLSGEVVFSEGDPADVFFVIASGEVELRSEQEGSVLAQLGPGETFGEQSILVGGVRSLSAIAKTELEVTEVRADLLRDALARSTGLIRPSFEALLLQLYLSNSLQLKGHPNIH